MNMCHFCPKTATYTYKLKVVQTNTIIERPTCDTCGFEYMLPIQLHPEEYKNELVLV